MSEPASGPAPVPTRAALRSRGQSRRRDPRAIRPFVVTRGRVQAPDNLRLETLIELARTEVVTTALTPEQHAILEHLDNRYMTVAEVSAHLGLPLGVVRVLVAELADLGAVLVHDTAPTATAGTATGANNLTLELLESVIDGLSLL
jgi:hypothetical protein